MRRKILSGWSYYVFAPPVVLLIAISFWIVVRATVDNYRAAQAHAQIVDIISEARSMRVSADMDPSRVAQEFFKRVSENTSYDVIKQPPSLFSNEPSYTLKNPWGGGISVSFYPSARSFRLEMPLSSLACRKVLLNLAALDNKVVRLRRVDVKEDNPARLWRMVYIEGSDQEATALHPPMIYSGCGDDANDLLSLTFYL